MSGWWSVDVNLLLQDHGLEASFTSNEFDSLLPVASFLGHRLTRVVGLTSQLVTHGEARQSMSGWWSVDVNLLLQDHGLEASSNEFDSCRLFLGHRIETQEWSG
jgi:hypothetical protein